MRLKIAGGCVYDPAQGWQGEVRDLFVSEGRMAPSLAQVDRILDAAGKAVLPGGVDLRAPLAGLGQDFLRLRGWVPTPAALGEAYALLGYTHVHEPFLTLATAGYVHRELAALPLVDTSASLVVNLRDLDLYLAAGDRLAEVGQTLRALLTGTRSLNLRVAEPFVRYRQGHYGHRTMKTEKALEVLTELAREEDLPLVLEAGPEVLRAGLPEPRAVHLASLGGALAEDGLVDAALRLLEAGATGDLGLSPLDRGAGVAVKVDLGWFEPLIYGAPPDKARVRRTLSLALGYAGEGLAFSAAGPVPVVQDYPLLFSWLGDRAARRRALGMDLGPRQYSPTEFVWATRTLPARLLGLPDRGHLRPGARADLGIFDLPEAPEHWGHLCRCRTLLKAGTAVVEDFQVVQPRAAKATYFRNTEAEPTRLLGEVCQFYSLRPENLRVAEALGGPWVEL
jgi:formylmethanofuran dehydrogenase subunit A